MNPVKAIDYRRTKHILLFSFLVVLAAQININLYLNNFKISIAIILFPIFVFLWNDFPIIRVTFLSGAGVFLSRFLITWLRDGQGFHTLLDYYPEALFYITYGLLLYVYHLRNHELFTKKISFLFLLCLDFFANLVEIILRFGLDGFTLKNMSSIFIVAVIRTILLSVAITILRHSHIILLKQEHALRYQKLLLLISKLSGEIIWMKRNTVLIEETMNASYQLYNQLKQYELPEDLSQSSLHVAKEIHEIKKEYALILRGLSEALDMNVKDDGMYMIELLKLLETTLTTSDNNSRQITFSIHCNPSLYTEQHYFFLSIFRNLFQNAIEACMNSPVHIYCDQSETEECYCFTIRDNGTGISSEYLSDIFQPGFSTKINYETGEISRGLGLNLVQDFVVTQLDGTITVDSSPQGTVFIISIPKSKLKVVS